MPNLIGKGGEVVTHASLKSAVQALDASSRIKCMLERNEGGDIRRLFGEDVPSGPLDNAAHFMIREATGVPQIVTAVIEVKNLRHWLYPEAAEIFQLLEKAIRLQIAHPHQFIVPVLVCRQRQYLTLTMARDLGFFAVPMVVQPMLPHTEVAPEHFHEVCNELGYNLIQTEDSLESLQKFFELELPRYALYNARKWRSTAQALESILPTLVSLRRPGLPWHVRARAMQALRQVSVERLEAAGEWTGDVDDSDDRDNDIPL